MDIVFLFYCIDVEENKGIVVFVLVLLVESFNIFIESEEVWVVERDF